MQTPAGNHIVGRTGRRAGAVARKAKNTPLARAVTRYQTTYGSRLAAAVTYAAFLSLFPLIAVAVAITAATLGPSGTARLRQQIYQNLPGLADKLPLNPIVQNAATIGVISGVLLLWSGLFWVNMLRGSLRAIWAVEDVPGGFVRRKLIDLVSLAELGIVGLVSLSASAVTTSLAATILRAVHIADTSAARVFLSLLAIVVGLLASTVLFALLLAAVPRLSIPRRVLAGTALGAAILFEVTKNLLGLYIDHVAGRSLYGAFGVPVAVLLWLNITFQVLLYMSAWTATRTSDVIQT